MYILRFGRTGYIGLASVTLIGSGMGLLIGGFAYYWEEMKQSKIGLPPRPKIRHIKETKRNKHLDKIAARLARNSGEDILRAGVNNTPHAFYYKWVNYGLWSMIAAIPASFALAFILKDLIPLIALSVPLFVVFIIPPVSLKSTAGDRKRAMEDELPFFSLYVSTLADAGISLYDAMKRLIGRGVFQYVERDAVYLERSVEFMGQDQLSAVDMVARSHP
ncbi:MAG: hypothetical protein QXF41_03150, partial [Candidatus Micrarchaeaceae archaeon]